MTLRQLSALYLVAASGFSLAIGLAHHPAWRSNAEVAAAYVRLHGGNAVAAIDANVLRPGAAFVGRESVALYDTARNAIAPPPVKVAASKPAPRRMAARPAPRVAPKPVVVAAAPPKPAPRIAAATPPAPQIAAPNLATPPSAPAYVPHLVHITPALRPAIVNEPAPVVADASPARKPTLAPQAVAPKEPSPPAARAVTAPSAPPLGGAEVARVEQRLKDSLTHEMFENFGLFLYVSKASAGPWAQHMYVFQKQPSGDLALLYNWPVSTGREKVEFNDAGAKLPSFTPAGYYELDPKRLFPHYRSVQWDQPMPYAMFFNWVDHGNETGLAIHGASGEDIGLLGTRASAGCIRLSPENARVLFSLIHENYKGLVPKFAYDKRTATMMNNGMLLHDVDGRLQLASGYKVLIFVEDYGGENVVAALF